MCFVTHTIVSCSLLFARIEADNQRVFSRLHIFNLPEEVVHRLETIKDTATIFYVFFPHVRTDADAIVSNTSRTILSSELSGIKSHVSATRIDRERNPEDKRVATRETCASQRLRRRNVFTMYLNFALRSCIFMGTRTNTPFVVYWI